MNNIRIPTYKKLAICFLVLAICFLVLLSIIYLNFYGTHTELVDSYSLGRYRIVFGGLLQDSTYKTRLEYSRISHKVVFPYLYVKGESGYTRVLLTPIGTDILKIPNYSFYDTASIIEDIASINSLKRIYGKSISIKDDLNQISEEDRIIFKSLE